jgi:hypothetical protein
MNFNKILKIQDDLNNLRIKKLAEIEASKNRPDKHFNIKKLENNTNSKNLIKNTNLDNKQKLIKQSALDERLIKNINLDSKEKLIKQSAKIGVVITTHGNNGVYVRQCLECFIRELPNNYYIVLYVNESTDIITRNLYKEYSTNKKINIIYIEDQNKFGGLTGTWNNGIDLCLKENCDVIVLSNDDLLFDSCINNIIWSCYNDKSNNKYFGPISNNPGPKNCPINKCQYGEKPIITDDKKALYKNTTCNLNGFFMVFSKNVLIKNKYDKINYFNPEYPFGGNETEWFIRFKKKGGIPIIVSKTFIYHYKLSKWRKNTNKLNNTCIYTVNTNSYEGTKIHFKKNNNLDLDILYFTDNFKQVYDCIKLNIIPFYVCTKNKDPKLIQRTIKVSPCDYLPNNYNRSIYVDGNLQIINYKLLNNYIKNINIDLICFKHFERRYVKDEEKVILKSKLETKENINKVIQDFKKYNFNDDIGLTETNILIRNHKNIQNFNKDWKNYVNICRRDQISFDFCLFKNNVNYRKYSYQDKLKIIKRHPHINPKNRLIKSV